MKYKVGDKVKVRTDLCAGMSYGNDTFVVGMKEFLGKTLTISNIFIGKYEVKEDDHFWTDEMFEGLVQVSFTLKDLKPCMVVKTRDCGIYMVVESKQGLIIKREESYGTLNTYNDDLTLGRGNKDFDIMEVYDFCEYNYKTSDVSTTDRKLLWKREEKPQVTELTLQQIADKMGVPVSQLRVKE